MNKAFMRGLADSLEGLEKTAFAAFAKAGVAAAGRVVKAGIRRAVGMGARAPFAKPASSGKALSVLRGSLARKTGFSTSARSLGTLAKPPLAVASATTPRLS